MIEVATDRANIGRASRSNGINGVLLGFSCRTRSTPGRQPHSGQAEPEDRGLAVGQGLHAGG